MTGFIIHPALFDYIVWWHEVVTRERRLQLPMLCQTIGECEPGLRRN